MKLTSILLFTAFIVNTSLGQDSVSIKLKELAVPNSPAFIIVDLTPSVFQSANTPKEFILGIAQSYQQSTDGFPQNYSAEFTPYWWINSGSRNVYSALGLQTTKDKSGKIIDVGSQTSTSGLKFTTVSLAFLNKDLIPDSLEMNQKVVSLGIKSTVLKFQQKNYGSKLEKTINDWHKAALDEFEDNTEIEAKLARFSGTREEQEKYQQKLLDNFKTERTGEILKEISELINQKPLFSWDVAAAFATYGIGDSVWRMGRTGVWTTLSSYLPIAISTGTSFKNYLNINFVFRYLFDKYQLSDDKKIVSNNNLDIGGKLALEFDRFSIGIEALYRFNNGESDSQNKTVGIINYKVADNLFIRGAFGKNFNGPDKLITLFGINWGFGSETVTLPNTD